ncbi:hypothetical protein ACFWY6_43830 [Streptomyces sp. NPDC059037]|uniref:hypothetical protein n=1 Tax=Streptomyces sp. NPDC059037 TaxID=3346710 RepID=UPI0036C5E0BF
MRHRRVLTFTLLAALTLSVTAITAPASAAQRTANPAPPLPPVESLITEGVTVEGPLVNSVALPHVL